MEKQLLYLECNDKNILSRISRKGNREIEKTASFPFGNDAVNCLSVFQNSAAAKEDVVIMSAGQCADDDTGRGI